jgi:hypothetical protein
MEFLWARINAAKGNALRRTRKQRAHSTTMEIDGKQRDVIRLSAGAMDLP